MQLKLEELEYQKSAVQSVLSVFDGTAKNTFDNATDEGIRFNLLTLSPESIAQNVNAIIQENGISETKANLSPDHDICIEMETGTGKTLVYIKTIFELYKHYGI